MSLILAISFCSVITCEDYQVADNLSKPECIRMMKEERKFLMSKPVEESYQEYAKTYNAEPIFNSDQKINFEVECKAESKFE